LDIILATHPIGGIGGSPMPVKHYMSRPVYVSPDATIRTVASIMCDRDVDAVIVGTPGGPLGIFSDRDLLRRVIKEGKPKDLTKVKEVMSSPLVTVGPDTDVEEAYEIMFKNNFRRLPVERGGKIIGIALDTDLKRAAAYYYAARNGRSALGRRSYHGPMAGL
jgi:CBS domain-containing protein